MDGDKIDNLEENEEDIDLPMDKDDLDERDLKENDLEVKNDELIEQNIDRSNIDSLYSKEEKKFFKDHQISIKSGKRRDWSWLNENTVNRYFQEIVYPQVKEDLNLSGNEGPTYDQVKKCGFIRFVGAYEKRGFKHNDLLKEAGFSMNYDPNKWNDLTLEKSVNHLKEILNHGLREVLGLKGNEGPTANQLRENGHRGFVWAYINKGIKHNEVLREAGLNINKDQNRWDNYTVEDYAEYLKVLLDNGLREELGLGDNEGPTAKQLKNSGNHDLVSAYLRNTVKHNDILVNIGLEINWDPSKWDDFTLESGAIYLNNLLENGLRQELGLEYNEAPTWDQLRDCGHGDFVRAFNNRNIDYTEIVKETGLNPIEVNISKEVGTNFHWIAERIFVESFREKGCYAFWEVYPSKNSEKNGLKRSDNSILRNAEFDKSIHLKPQHQNIKLVSTDYFLKYTNNKAIEKSNKGYQGKDKMLVLVPIFEKREAITSPENIPIRNNVIVMNSNEFAKFAGYEGKFLYEFDEAVRLAREAVFNEEAQARLADLANKSKRILFNHQYYTQESLEFRLREKNWLHILNESSDSNYFSIWFKNCKGIKWF